MKLRSSTLSRMPPTQIKLSDSIGRAGFRIISSQGILILLTALIVAIRLELLPKQGIGAFLYRLHDTLYLWLKGYTYTRFYPNSLIWWGIILTILFLILLSLFIDRSLIKEPHIRFIRYCMKRHRLHHFIIQGSYLLRRLGIRPYLLQKVAYQEWEKAIIQLSQKPVNTGSPSACQYIVICIQLQLKIAPLFPHNTTSSLRRLEQWHQTYLTIDAYGAINEPEFKRILDTLLRAFAFINPNDFGTINHPSETNQLFEPAQLFQEMATLCQLGEIRLHGSTSVNEQRQLEHTLLASIDRRRIELLDKAIIQLENQIKSPDRLLLLPLLTNSDETLAIAGRVSLNIALHLACLTMQPAIALAYVEAVEALAFLLDITNLKTPSTHKFAKLLAEPVAVFDDTLTQYVPIDRAYALIAAWFIQANDQQENQWDKILNNKDAPMQRKDFLLARTQIASFQQAIGPTK